MSENFSAVFDPVENCLGNISCLAEFVGGGENLDFVALSVLRPKIFFLLVGVVLDNGIGGVENIARRAVVLLETDGEGVLILLLKGENVLNGGASEAIDTLIVVAHHADVAVRRGKQLYEHILGVVRVLILVHHYVFEFMLIKGQHIGALLEKPHRPHDYVVKIHGVGLFKLC